jgi:leucyl aminopeptidase (aminopeptidase T)
LDIRLIELAKILKKPLELNARAGDKIFILTDTKMDPVLWQALAIAANSMDIEPSIGIMTPRGAHSTDPTSALRAACLDPGTDLCIYLTSTAMAHARLTDDMIETGRRFILMEELTPEMLAPDGPASADYFAINALGQKIAALFTAGETVRVTCPNGTDLTCSIAGRPGRSIAGIPMQMHPGKGGGCAFPDGEAHVCPVEGTGEGTVVFDFTAHSVGKITEPLRLTVKAGMVTEISGGREAEIWRDILARHGDPDSFNCPAEVAIGLNPKVKQTGSMRTDKKLYGSCHIGMGDTIALGGTCHAKLRLEGVIRTPEVTIDGQMITSDGKILID